MAIWTLETWPHGGPGHPRGHQHEDVVGLAAGAIQIGHLPGGAAHALRELGWPHGVPRAVDASKSAQAMPGGTPRSWKRELKLKAPKKRPRPKIYFGKSLESLFHLVGVDDLMLLSILPKITDNSFLMYPRVDHDIMTPQSDDMNRSSLNKVTWNDTIGKVTNGNYNILQYITMVADYLSCTLTEKTILSSAACYPGAKDCKAPYHWQSFKAAEFQQFVVVRYPWPR